jgi:hypothetical protein
MPKERETSSFRRAIKTFSLSYTAPSRSRSEPRFLGSESSLTCMRRSEQLVIHERQYAEVASQLSGLVERAEELAVQQAEMTQEKDRLTRVLEEGRCFTKAEVSRLNSTPTWAFSRNSWLTYGRAGEFEALQKLHGWTLDCFTKDAATLIHLRELSVTLEVVKGCVATVSLELLPSNRKPIEQETTSFLFQAVQARAGTYLGASPKVRLPYLSHLVAELASFGRSSCRMSRHCGRMSLGSVRKCRSPSFVSRSTPCGTTGRSSCLPKFTYHLREQPSTSSSS